MTVLAGAAVVHALVLAAETVAREFPCVHVHIIDDDGDADPFVILIAPLRGSTGLSTTLTVADLPVPLPDEPDDLLTGRALARLRDEAGCLLAAADAAAASGRFHGSRSRRVVRALLSDRHPQWAGQWKVSLDEVERPGRGRTRNTGLGRVHLVESCPDRALVLRLLWPSIPDQLLNEIVSGWPAMDAEDKLAAIDRLWRMAFAG